MPIHSVQLTLWDLLADAERAPTEVDFHEIWVELDGAMEIGDPSLQLQIAGDAISRIAEVFAQRSDLAFQDLEATTAREGPVMDLREFERYVRQSMPIDWEDYLEPLGRLPGLPTARGRNAFDEDSWAGEVPKSVLLEVLEDLQHQPTEAEQIQQIKSLSHGEDVLLWSSQLTSYLRETFSSGARTVTFLDLPQALGMPITEVWLGFLLGEHEYQLRRTGEDFYEAGHLEVVLKSDCPAVG